jgi:YVTN family beta-propeller protein
MLRPGRFIPIPNSAGSAFDHGAYDPTTGRVFVAHTAANTLEVLDHREGRFVQTLPDFPEAAGVVVGDRTVLVTNRGSASLAVVDSDTLARHATIPVIPRPNGVALAPRKGLAVVACIGDESHAPALHCLALAGGEQATLPLPGRPRWCVVDGDATRVFLAIQEPSVVLVAGLPDLAPIAQWPLPSAGAHGIDIDVTGNRLFVACDGGALVAVDTGTGTVLDRWPLPGGPDATFYNPDSGLVHVAVGNPGVVVSVDPTSGRTGSCATEARAGTTALVPPDRLYVFLRGRGGALELIEAST